MQDFYTHSTMHVAVDDIKENQIFISQLTNKPEEQVYSWCNLLKDEMNKEKITEQYKEGLKEMAEYYELDRALGELFNYLLNNDFIKPKLLRDDEIYYIDIIENNGEFSVPLQCYLEYSLIELFDIDLSEFANFPNRRPIYKTALKIIEEKIEAYMSTMSHDYIIQVLIDRLYDFYETGQLEIEDIYLNTVEDPMDRYCKPFDVIKSPRFFNDDEYFVFYVRNIAEGKLVYAVRLNDIVNDRDDQDAFYFMQGYEDSSINISPDNIELKDSNLYFDAKHAVKEKYTDIKSIRRRNRK